ncbi:MAG TPA: BatA and WFA domain-containing protein [Polyangiaceae bacterium]|nr:BatA and WFA domain-containing protein [Polyangiaceae bacterium]
MSFVTILALGLSALIAAPTLAHLLRRGRVKEQPFPAASLVPATRATARERSRLEDRGLLALRALMILCLAVIGAGPLVRCSRVALGRTGGASVAIALVVDDSASMKTRLSGGKTRFARALEGARELLATAREGDAIALVQAGKPARLTLAASTDLNAATRALAELKPSDRATDLQAAIGLAHAALSGLPHKDKRVVLLSDLAGPLGTEPAPDVWAALPELATPADDCAVLQAARDGQRVSANLACSSEATARGRSLLLKSRDGSSKAEARLVVQRGEQSLVLELKGPTQTYVELTGQDQNPDDDRAEIAPESRPLSLAVLADPEREAVVTGGAPVLEQALHALATSAAVRPLPELPREEGELRDVAALFIDDPPGLTPETRGTITSWLENGAVAALFLGARAHDTQLGANLEPFVRGAVDWETLAAGTVNVDVRSFDWLGAESESLKDLAPKGRARLDTALVPGAEVVGRWSDGKVLVTRQELGRGLLFSVGLPVSVEVSDFALRPAFLALLDHMAGEALRRRGPRASVAGTEWWFSATGALQISGSSGPLALREADGQRVATPENTGRYEISLNGKAETRFITLAPEEVLNTPQQTLPAAWRKPQAGAAPQVDASPGLGWALLGLLALEIAVRVARLWRERRAHNAIQATPT